MENAVCYIKSRDRQRAAAAAVVSSITTTAAASATAAAATTTTTTTTSSSSSSTASVPAAMKAKSALQFAAFVSGRRSLSAVEMQAKIKKMVAPKPAFPASSRPALPFTSSVEPSSKELVKAVVDIEESSDVQAPLLLLTAAASTSTTKDEPTDEELLKATQGRDDPAALLIRVQGRAETLPLPPPPQQPPPPPRQPPPPQPAAAIPEELPGCRPSPGAQLSLQGSRTGSAGCCLPGTAVGGLGSPASSISGGTPHKPGRSGASLGSCRPPTAANSPLYSRTTSMGMSL